MEENNIEQTVLKPVQKNNRKKTTIAVLAALLLIGGAIWLNQLSPASLSTQNAKDTVQRLNNQNPNQEVLSIVSEESMAKYEIDEVLNGVPTHVVGETRDIAGDVAITTEGPLKVHIGEVRLNAKTFKTDIAKRDENVIKFVLESDKPGNEFISFKPSNIDGIPEAMETNKEYPITITGDIAIKGVTKQVSFEGSAKLEDGKTLKITANTILNRPDFGITIPNFPFLANVSEMVKLTVDLVAR